MPNKKTAKFNDKGIESLAKDKPVVYQIFNGSDKNIYTGVAKRGRAEERIKEHLSGGPHPIRGGSKVKITQKPSIDAARKSEAKMIKVVKPSQNKKGK